MNQKPFRIGFTKVRVMRKNEDGRIVQAQDGVVVGMTNSFVRVFHMPKAGEEMTTMHVSEWFAISSRYSWVEQNGELKEKLFMPADL